MANLTAGASTGTFNIGALISGAFSILHGALPSFLALAVIPVVPAVLSLILVGTPTVSPEDPGAYLRATWVFTLGSVILSLMIQGAMVYGAFNQMRGRPFSVGESLSKGFVRFLPLLGVAVLSGLAITIGFLLVIIPGIWLVCMFYVAVPVCVAEHGGVTGSLSRSAELTKGYRWKILGLALIVGIGTIVVSGILSFIGRMIAGPIGGSIVGLVLQVYTIALFGILAALSYYTLRSIKEGIDIDRIANVFD